MLSPIATGGRVVLVAEPADVVGSVEHEAENARREGVRVQGVVLLGAIGSELVRGGEAGREAMQKRNLASARAIRGSVA